MTELRKVTQLSWRKFVQSEEGKEGLLILRERTPSIEVGNAEGIIFQAGIAEGHKKCLDAIMKMLGAEPKREVKIEND